MITKSKRARTLKTALRFGVGMGAMFAAFAAPTHAQEADDTDEARKLQTITVTATKREQTLQDVPVAVSVVDDQVIEQAEIIDLGDLQSLVPSLSVGQLQSSANTNFRIRGFGNGANNAGIEPSVGVFIDGVYRSRSAAQIGDLPNLQRVEVLRGPQSTLFGKNASAGVISVVTQAPQFDFGGGLEFTKGNFNSLRLKGDITGPITDNLAFSLAGNINSRNGYAEDLATGSKVNERERYGVRGQLQFEPTDNLSFRLIADYDEIDEICCVAGNLINGPTGAIIQGVIGGQLNAEDPFSYEVFNNFDSTNEITNDGISLQGDFEMDFATLTSITAYRTSDLNTNQDSDFTSSDNLSQNSNNTEIETFTQEIRLTSNNTDGPIDWMIGGFYFDEKVDIENQILYGDDFRLYADSLVAAAGAPGALSGLEAALFGPAAVGTVFAQSGQGLTESFGQDNTAYSFFGSVDYHATDKLTLTVGLNYTKDEKDARGAIVSTDAFSAVDFVDLAIVQTLAGLGVDGTDPAALGAFIAAQPATYAAIVAGANDPATNTLLALQPLQFFPQFVSFPNAVENGKSDDSDVTYSIRGAYDVNDNFNVYLSYATGFKASSWNLSRDSRPFPADFIPASQLTAIADPSLASPLRSAGLATPNLTTGTRFAEPEESKVWEIGVKAQFDRFAFNMALFDQTIEGFQSNVFTGTGFALANAGKQSAKGLEFDTNIQVTDNFDLVFAGTFIDPVYDSFVNSASGDISGQQPSGIPETSTTVAGTYNFTLKNDWDGYIRGDWQYTSDAPFFDDSANEALVRSGGYTSEVNLLNGSIGLSSPDGFSLAVWGRNLTDEEFITTAFPSVGQAGSISGYPNQPRTYGVTLRKEF